MVVTFAIVGLSITCFLNVVMRNQIRKLTITELPNFQLCNVTLIWNYKCLPIECITEYNILRRDFGIIKQTLILKF